MEKADEREKKVKKITLDLAAFTFTDNSYMNPPFHADL